jgi:hypothetical protein
VTESPEDASQEDWMNQLFKTLAMSCAIALAGIAAGCATSPAEPAEGETTAALGNACDAFCRGQGGPNYLFVSASSLAVCTSKGGDWYTADQGYTGPPPGCCCKCTRPGFCL